MKAENFIKSRSIMTFNFFRFESLSLLSCHSLMLAPNFPVHLQCLPPTFQSTLKACTPISISARKLARTFLSLPDACPQLSSPLNYNVSSLLSSQLTKLAPPFQVPPESLPHFPIHSYAFV
jgi:hypothetical protein